MKRIKRLVLSLMLAFGITAGTVVVAPIAFATPAQAYSSWTWETIRCDYVYVYRHYDFDWWEEVFQGKRDYDQYLYQYYRYNWACHNLKPY